MRTEFSITAKQIEKIFPESWLKPNENIVFRSIIKEDVDTLFDMDRFCSKQLYQGSVDGKNVYLIAVFHKKEMIGYISTGTASEKTLSLIRVFVREDCRKKHGLGTALLLVFFCFAVYLKVELVEFIDVQEEPYKMLRKIGITNFYQPLPVGDAIEQLRKKGIDLSKYRA